MIRRAYIHLEKYWNKYKPENVGEKDIQEMNNRFKEIEGNLYFVMLNMMERVKLHFNLQSWSKIDILVKWSFIDTFLNEIMEKNVAEGQFEGGEDHFDWPRSLKTRNAPDKMCNINRKSILLRQSEPVGEG